MRGRGIKDGMAEVVKKKVPFFRQWLLQIQSCSGGGGSSDIML